MTFLVEVPEFTLQGSGLILGISVVFGAAAGLAYAARRSGATGWRRYGPRTVAVVLFVPFASAGVGAAVVASVPLFTPVITRPFWPRVFRGLLWFVAALLTALVAREAVREGGVITGVIGTLLYVVLVYPSVLGVRIELLPRVARERAGPEG